MIEEIIKEKTSADHLLYVSLKYTKTCEVIKSAVNKLISAIDFAVIAGLESLKVKNISNIAKMRMDQLQEKIQMNNSHKKYIHSTEDYFYRINGFHNAFIEVLVSLGLVGEAAFVITIVTVFYRVVTWFLFSNWYNNR